MHIIISLADQHNGSVFSPSDLISVHYSTTIHKPHICLLSFCLQMFNLNGVTISSTDLI